MNAIDDRFQLYDLRRFGASVLRAMGMEWEHVELFGGWAPGSTSLRAFYVEPSLRVTR